LWTQAYSGSISRFLLRMIGTKVKIEIEPAEDRFGRLIRKCFIYLVLPLLNVRITFVPVTF